MNAPTTPQKSTARPDRLYTLLVGGLIVLILATLLYLWVNERKRRKSAEAALAKMQQANRLLSQHAMGGDLFGGGPGGQTLSARDIVAKGPGELNGQLCTVLTVDADAAARLGLKPGEVLRAAPLAGTTQPARSGESPGN